MYTDSEDTTIRDQEHGQQEGLKECAGYGTGRGMDMEGSGYVERL